MKPYLMLTAVALVCVPAFAQNQPEPSTSSVFDALDTNKDGRISKAEAQGHPVVSQAFASADADGDGSLTRQEFNSTFTTRPTQTTPPPGTSPEAGPTR